MSASHDDDAPKLTVPKFSSFKGATKSPGTASSHNRTEDKKDRYRRRHRHESGESQIDETLRAGGAGGERSSAKDRTPRDARSPRRHGSRHKRNRSQSADAEPEAKRPQPSRHEESTGVAGLYMIDTKGDPLLRKYGNNVHYHIPPSYRYPPGRILGARGRLYIHRDGQRERFSILQPGESPDFREGLRKWPRAHPNPITLRPQRGPTEDADKDLSFLQIGKPMKHKRLASSESEASDDEQGLSYRSIEGKMKVKQVPDDIESESDSDEAIDLHQDNPLRWRSVQLNRQVKEHPDDIDAWLELVQHQDALLKAGHDIDSSLLENEARSYAEIKVSLLESALSNVQGDQDRRRVWQLLMREGAKVWDRKTVAKKWSEIPEEEKHTFELWKTHLDFRMSDVTSFQYEEVKTTLLSRLRWLITADANGGRKSNVEEAIYVLLRLTRMMFDAGYRELSLSAWQAIFELNIFRPMADGSDASMESFQEFWESEVPRFGEIGAQGWRHFVASNGIGDPLEPQPQVRQRETMSRDPYKLWAALEQEKAHGARVPARTLDEGNDDDPFRVVMFSDIEPLLFTIDPDVLDEVVGQLVDGFLLFSGFPPAHLSNAWTMLASRDPCVVSRIGRLQLETPSDQSSAGEEMLKQPPKFAERHVHATVTLDILITDKSWYQYLPSSGEDTSISKDMVQRALQHTLQARRCSHVGTYLLALTLLYDPASTKKQAKALLKRFPTDMDLYAAYALAESVQGRHEVADKTFASACELTSGEGRLDLIWAWAWAQMQRGNRSAALRLLCSVADPELRKDQSVANPPSSSQVLKATQSLAAETDAFLYSENWKAVATAGQCSMLLSYLTSTDTEEPVSPTQGNLSASLATVKRLRGELRNRKAEHSQGTEQLLQASARLMYWHTSKGPFRRYYMRQQLMGYVSAFPQNTIFLSLLEWFDSGLRVVDETRQLLRDQCLTPSEDSLSGRVFAIRHEMERGNINSTKAAFEQAVNSDACRSSVLIWIWYIQFSYAHKSLRPKVKDLFYRALRNCPWSKEVMMQAFTTLVRIMESDELRAVYDTMTSKGMRIHVEMDDFMKEQERKRARRHEKGK